MPSSRVWAPGIIQDQGVSGEFGGPRLRKQATANCSANHSVSSWGWMELAELDVAACRHTASL